MTDTGLDAFALPTAYRLDDYEIMRVLGYGGFGITYLAQERATGDRLAIKEYFPTDLSARLENGGVTAQTEEDREVFDWGLAKFVKEAQTLARFSHPNIVRVRRFLNLNSTAYMVMDYQQGVPLGEILDEGGDLSETEILEFLPPLLDGLGAVHQAGVLHRDIKPDNIIIRQDGQPILIDFGAARMEVGQQSRSLHRVFTPGYAAPEQYVSGEEQGPWTDIYGMAAVLYSAISGRAPLEAPARTGAMMRSSEDALEPARRVGEGRYQPEFLAAIDWGLEIEPQHRPQSVAVWRPALLDGEVLETRGAGVPDGAAAGDDAEETDIPTLVAGRPAATETPPAAAQEPKKRRLWPVLVAVLILVGCGAGLGWYLLKSQEQAAAEATGRSAESERRTAEADRRRSAGAERDDADQGGAERRRSPDAAARRKVWRVGADPAFESTNLRDALTRAPEGASIVIFKRVVQGGYSIARNLTVVGTGRGDERTLFLCYDEPCVAFNGSGTIRNLNIVRRRRGFDGPAIRVNDGVVRIENVNISSHGGAGIDIARGQVLLLKSWIYENGHHGIIIRPSAQDVRITENKIFLNLRTGIVINARTTTMLQKNVVERNRRHGVMILGSSKATLKGNTIHRNQGAGIHLSRGAGFVGENNAIEKNWRGRVMRRK